MKIMSDSECQDVWSLNVKHMSEKCYSKIYCFNLDISWNVMCRWNQGYKYLQGKIKCKIPHIFEQVTYRETVEDL